MKNLSTHAIWLFIAIFALSTPRAAMAMDWEEEVAGLVTPEHTQLSDDILRGVSELFSTLKSRNDREEVIDSWVRKQKGQEHHILSWMAIASQQNHDANDPLIQIILNRAQYKADTVFAGGMTMLHYAAVCDCPPMAIYAVNNGANINAKNSENYTPLELAEQTKSIHVKYYLQLLMSNR